MTSGSLPWPGLFTVAGALVGLDPAAIGAPLQTLPVQFVETHTPVDRSFAIAAAMSLGTIERQPLTARSVARDAHGIIVGIYDERADTTRDAHGVLVGRGNLLIAFLVPK